MTVARQAPGAQERGEGLRPPADAPEPLRDRTEGPELPRGDAAAEGAGREQAAGDPGVGEAAGPAPVTATVVPGGVRPSTVFVPLPPPRPRDLVAALPPPQGTPLAAAPPPPQPTPAVPAPESLVAPTAPAGPASPAADPSKSTNADAAKAPAASSKDSPEAAAAASGRDQERSSAGSLRVEPAPQRSDGSPRSEHGGGAVVSAGPSSGLDRAGQPEPSGRLDAQAGSPAGEPSTAQPLGVPPAATPFERAPVSIGRVGGVLGPSAPESFPPAAKEPSTSRSSTVPGPDSGARPGTKELQTQEASRPSMSAALDPRSSLPDPSDAGREVTQIPRRPPTSAGDRSRTADSVIGQHRVCLARAVLSTPMAAPRPDVLAQVLEACADQQEARVLREAKPMARPRRTSFRECAATSPRFRARKRRN